MTAGYQPQAYGGGGMNSLRATVATDPTGSPPVTGCLAS